MHGSSIYKPIIHHGNYREVLSHVQADLILTSPPYNISTRGKRDDGFRKIGCYDPRSFAGITGYPDELPESEYQQQQANFIVWGIQHLKPSGTLVYNHKPRRNKRLIHPAEWFLLPEVRAVAELMEECVWDRRSTHNKCRQMLHAQTERLYVFRRKGDSYALRSNHSRSDLWSIPFYSNNAKKLAHCAPFPEKLAEEVILTWSSPGDVVIDPYSGSGTTAVAAQRLGRRFEGAEGSREYCDRSRERVAEAHNARIDA